MTRLYELLNLPPFKHDFENVSYEGGGEFDLWLGVPGLKFWLRMWVPLYRKYRWFCGREDCENAVRNSSQPALQIRYPPRKWRRSHGDVASTKTKDFIAICQSTRPVRDTDQCKAERS